VQQVARRDGNVLVWVGEGAPEPTAASVPTAPIAAEALAAPTAPDSGERRQLTVMFCDLVGSTELAQRIDPEEGELVREYRAVCVDATKRFDGHVAQYLGDGVMVYFGWPQAHEDDAGRAIRAGLEIQRVLGERPEARRIDARVGIHTGLVVVEQSSRAWTRPDGDPGSSRTVAHTRSARSRFPAPIPKGRSIG
jgi:class 3 adenylate cyclase